MLIVAAIHSFIGTSCTYYSTSLNLLDNDVKKLIIESSNVQSIDDVGVDWRYSLLSCGYVLGTALFYYPSALCMDRLGRRTTIMVVASGMTIMAGLVQYLCTTVFQSWQLLLVGRLMSGFANQMSYFIIPFLTECSANKDRGFVATMPAIGWTVWVPISNIVALLLMHNSNWGLVFLVPVFPSLIYICITPFIHESPKHLYIGKQDDEKARKAAVFYQGATVAHVLIN